MQLTMPSCGRLRASSASEYDDILAERLLRASQHIATVSAVMLKLLRLMRLFSVNSAS
jgi:hypothetical protein